MTTDYEKRGGALVVTEGFNTSSAYTFTSISGQLSDVSCYRAILLANSNNASDVYIGGESSITFPLAAGFGLSLEIENLNVIHAYVPTGNSLHALILKEV